METLLDVIDLLPKDIIKRDILTIAVNKGQLSQPISSRLLCCKMLGKICTKFDPYVIRKEILPVVQSLCQDVDYEVRGCMCRQLDIVARGIGLEATKSAILPELVELANDEESLVRLAGIETVVHMLPMLDDETCIQAIIPLVKKFCENSIRTEDATLPVVSRQLGRLCHGLSVNLTSEQCHWFLNYYRQLGKLGLSHHKQEAQGGEYFSMAPMPDIVPAIDNQDRFTECRHACAYNFPAMVLFAGPENFSEELYKTFSNLCSDPHYKVRHTMACGFHEVTKLLGQGSFILLPELVFLLKDDSLEVLKGLIPHLPESLETVTGHWNLNPESKKEDLGELVHAMVTCEEATSLTSNWRLHADFLTCLSCLPRCLSAEQIYTTFVPLLFIKLHTARPIPCRVAAAYSLLVFLRNTPKLEQRNGIINQLIDELCRGRSCHRRMLYIRVCELVMELFSKAFFKQHFFKALLSLAEDPVPNVRLHLCSVLPRLKALMKLPTDGTLLQELEACVRKLMTDENDRDVTAAVQNAIEDLDRIEVSMEPGSRRTSCAEPEIDLADLQKEEEEKKLLEIEAKEKQQSETKSAKSSSSKNLTRQGKIPVRKSSTLPKQSKCKEPKRSPSNPRISASTSSLSGTLSTRGPGLQEKRASCPSVNTEATKSKGKNTITKDSATLSLAGASSSVSSSTKSSIPKSRISSPSSATRIPSPHGSVKQTLPVDRCPSPMPVLSPPPPPAVLDQLSLYHSSLVHMPPMDCTPLSSQRAPSPHPAAAERRLAEDIDSSLIYCSGSHLSVAERAESFVPQSGKVRPNYIGTPAASPEIPHRSITSPCPSPALPSPSSRIPTPTSSLRRRSMIGNS